MVTPDGNDLIFILSAPRAGSTLLGAILGNHSQALCPPEPWLLLPLNAIRSPDVEIIAAYGHSFAREAWRHLASGDVFGQAFGGFAATIYNSLLEQAGKRVMVDKTPRYYHILPYLEALFPQAFKIWLRRNPLDVIASCKETWNLTIDELLAEVISPHSFDTTISFALLADYFENNISTQYTLRYEDLVQDPFTQIESLCNFIGLPFEEGMVNYGTNRALMKVYAEAVMGDKKVADHIQPHTGSVGRWREVLTPEEIKQTLLMLGRATFTRQGYGDVIDEAAGRIGLNSTEIDESGKLGRAFEQYAAYLDNNLPDSIGGQRTLIERENARLSASWANSEADRVARLAVIEEQGRRLGEVEADRALRLAVIQRQEAELSQFQQLAQKNTELQMLLDQRAVRILKRLKLIQHAVPALETGDLFYQAIRRPKRLGGVNCCDPEVINNVISGLQSFGYTVKPYAIDVAGYQAYLDQAAYKEKYPTYASNLPEKSLEHYIATELLNLKPDDVYIDIASSGSPVPEIYNRLFGCTTYRQDLAYPEGLNGDTIGGNAASMPIPDGFASKIGLHCSFEHFEGDSDIGFIEEANRVLRPGGAICIVPFYLFDQYAIQTDPHVSVPEEVKFEDDATVFCHSTWGGRHGRFYDPAHLMTRVHNHLSGMTMNIYKITNARAVDPGCYVEFAALITKPSTDLLRRMYDIRTSMEQVLGHFVALGFSPATVLDVGVAYGTPALYSTFHNAHHVLIEPLVEFEENLKDICSQHNAEYVLAAASANPGRLEIAITSDLVGSSLLIAKSEETVVWREVPVVTLDGICKERGLKGPYVVKVDVQGAELHVLDGANTVLKDTEVVILEVSFFRFTDGFPEFGEVVHYMKERGFAVYELFGGHNRPLDGARAQADVVFVKEGGRFRASHAWATPEQSAEFRRLA